MEALPLNPCLGFSTGEIMVVIVVMVVMGFCPEAASIAGLCFRLGFLIEK